MNTHKLKLYVGTLAVLLFIPNFSSAYFTTAQSATRINAETILFTVTYQFGFLNRELYMPIGALRGLEAASASPYVGFKIMNGDTELATIGKTNSIVLTKDEDVQFKDNQYYTPDRKSAEFTLVTLLTIPVEQQTKDLDLSLLVTRLPFTMVKDGTPIPAHLNPSELQYYRTPTIDFGTKTNIVQGDVHTLTTK